MAVIITKARSPNPELTLVPADFICPLHELLWLHRHKGRPIVHPYHKMSFNTPMSGLLYRILPLCYKASPVRGGWNRS